MSAYVISAVVGEHPFHSRRLRAVIDAPDIYEAFDVGYAALERQLGRKPLSVWAQRARPRPRLPVCTCTVTARERSEDPGCPVHREKVQREQLAREKPAAVDGRIPPTQTPTAVGLQLADPTRCHHCGAALEPKRCGGYDPATRRAFCVGCAP